MSSFSIKPGSADALSRGGASGSSALMRSLGANVASTSAKNATSNATASFAQELRDASAVTRTAGAVEGGGRSPASAKTETGGCKKCEQAHKAAADLVSDIFVSPMLAEMRQFPFGRSFGNGGRGEEVFGEQLDQRIAGKVTAGGLGGLTQNIAAKILDRDRRPGVAETPAAGAANAAQGAAIAS